MRSSAVLSIAPTCALAELEWVNSTANHTGQRLMDASVGTGTTSGIVFCGPTRNTVECVGYIAIRMTGKVTYLHSISCDRRVSFVFWPASVCLRHCGISIFYSSLINTFCIYIHTLNSTDHRQHLILFNMHLGGAIRAGRLFLR
jgi:hypothetical protein